MHVTQRHSDAVDKAAEAAEPETQPTPAPVNAESSCTVSQLRRFIKSRPYVPMHELRRRFELNGDADEVCGLQTADGVIYLGLPRHETELMGELLRQGEVGFELCSDPRAPIVVGVYAMRPITRA